MRSNLQSCSFADRGRLSRASRHPSPRGLAEIETLSTGAGARSPRSAIFVHVEIDKAAPCGDSHFDEGANWRDNLGAASW
jgi:hypothetical protein